MEGGLGGLRSLEGLDGWELVFKGQVHCDNYCCEGLSYNHDSKS
jgi:hypothetical protein